MPSGGRPEPHAAEDEETAAPAAARGATAGAPGAPAAAHGAAPPHPARAPVLSPRFVRVLVANFCFFMTFATFFLLPVRIRELGGNDQQVGLVMGLLGVSGLAGVFVVGTLIDRLGCRVFLRGGLIGMSAIALAFSFVDSVGPAMMALRVLQGLAFSAGFNAASTLAAAFAPVDRRATALGIFGVSTLTTHALAPTIGEQVVRLASFPALFAVSAGFAAIGLVVAWSLPEPLGAAGAEAARQAAAAAGEDAASPASVGHATPASAARRKPKRHPLPAALRASFVATACCGVAFGAVMTFVPTFTLDEHLGPVATFFLSYTTAAILTRLWAGRIADDFGLRRMILPATFVLSGSILGIAAVHSTLQLGIAGVVFGLAQGVVYPTLNAFSVDLAAPGELGRVQAFFNGSFNVGVTAGSLILGPIVHAFGHRVMFACASATALAALVIFALGTRRRPALA